MYLNILKKDIKRKKTMNIILLVFIMLSAMFVASSVNNIVTITTALDNYYEKAGGPDYFLATRGTEAENALKNTLGNTDSVISYKCENGIYVEGEIFFKDEVLDFKNTSLVMSFSEAAINFFDANDNIITEVEEGTVLLSGKGMKNAGISEGDVIDIKIDGREVSLEVKGVCKDVMLGSDFMGVTRIVLNEKDYEKLNAEDSAFGGHLWYINTEDTSEIVEAISEIDVLFNADEAMVKMTYVMDMVIAGVLLVVSVCLILVAFVVLRFTISFTLSEEFREIGVMKAIGIINTKIRGLYMVKYLMMAVTGAAIGFFASIPFGNMLLEGASEKMVLENNNTILINFICCLIVVAVISLFCYSCTGKVKRFTPIDAIRNGATGERFNKKSVLRLGKTSAKPSVFMALNDVLSSPKRYASIIVTYTLCVLLVLILVNTANTLKSGSIISSFGVCESDLYLSAYEDELMSFMTADGKGKFENKLADIEAELSENGLYADCSVDVAFKYNLTHGDNKFKSITIQGIGTTTDMYSYYEGTAPQDETEVAVTPLVGERLGAGIGDTITISHSFGERDYIITAFFQSMNNLGEGVRLHENAETDLSQASGFMALQIDFKDSPDDETIAERAEKMKDILNTDDVWTAGEFVEETVGVADMINAVKYLTLAVTLIITALVTILMERSFIAKEQSEIALMKAIGFKTGTVVNYHTMRFVITGIISTVIAAILSTPVTKLSVDPIFNMMGASLGVDYAVNPIEVFLIYPAITLAVTVLSAMLTSLYTRTITASQASGIE